MGGRTNVLNYDILCEHLADYSHDYFGYDELAKDVAKQLCMAKPPFVYALCGRWGSGKSSFIMNLLKYLPKPEDGGIVVYFNAWQGVIHNDILASFVNELISQICTTLPDISKEINQKSSVLLKAIIDSFSEMSPYTKSFSNLYKSLSASSQQSQYITSPKVKLRNTFEKIGHILSQKNISAYVIIDELDRCPPAIVVNMVETLRMLFSANDELQESVKAHNSISISNNNSNIPFKYILSIDEHYLSHSFSHMYGMKLSEAYYYFTKFVQYKYHFPEKKWDLYVSESLKSNPENSPWLPEGTSNDLVKILEVLNATPRETNRIFTHFFEWQRRSYDKIFKQILLHKDNLDIIIRIVNICLFLYACIKVIFPSLVRWYLQKEMLICLIDGKKMEYIKDYISNTKNKEMLNELLNILNKCVPFAEELLKSRKGA